MVTEDFVNMFSTDRFSDACRSFFSYEKVISVTQTLQDSKSARDEDLCHMLGLMLRARECEHLPTLDELLKNALNFGSMASSNYSNRAWSLLVEYTKVGVIGGVGSVLKNKGKHKLGRWVNSKIDKAANTIAAPVLENIEKLKKEMDFLEVSLLGCAVCNGQKGQYGGALNQLDKAVGIHLSPWMNLWGSINTFLKRRYDTDLDSLLNWQFQSLEGDLVFRYGRMYYEAMRVVEKAGKIEDISRYPNYLHMKKLATERR